MCLLLLSFRKQYWNGPIKLILFKITKLAEQKRSVQVAKNPLSFTDLIT